MRAVVMRAFGNPDVLEIEDMPAPTPQAEEAPVRVAAVGRTVLQVSDSVA
jgi:NADPH:quinone reductase-like Zn-dependent oxidoreductase